MKKYVLIALMLAPLCGCPVPPTPPVPNNTQRLMDSVSGAGYYLYVPSTYRKDKPSPVIITCHGTPPYDIAAMHIDEWKWYGETNNCIIIAPEMTGTDGIFGDGPVGAMIQDEKHIMGLISSLGYQYNIDMANIMITGFSGGGFPMYWVGLRHRDIFSVIVARSCNFSQGSIQGWYPPEAVTIPVYVYCGENDPGPIQEQSSNAVNYMRSLGFRVDTYQITGAGHDRHPEIAMDFFRHHMNPPRPSLPTTGSGK